MVNHQTLTDYDTNSNHYDQFRRPNTIIIRELNKYFSGAQGPILSVGCGTGRNEQELSKNHHLVGLDRSTGMLHQARGRLLDLGQADMTKMPFENDSFAGVYFMQSLHHVGANLSIRHQMRAQARKQALAEAVRVLKSGPLVIIQRDPSQNQAVWFWKYFPKALETKLLIQPRVSTLVEWLKSIGLSNITATPINDPMARNFYEPESPLDPTFRRSFSDFSYLSEADLEQGIQRLQESIENGSVHKEIETCKLRFKKIGGTVFMIFANKIGMKCT